ncbi:dnaJ homolog subfamily C member 16 [Onthophagus taurus]|uniref:dnaJ homolog subfamily C member 16 n=1 Tax=Onthophagus taurus TaxID=166361 RepID=UPI000C20EE06|nr:dnaJ homolog subfamily C member 16-like [Onthophagus taurus]
MIWLRQVWPILALFFLFLEGQTTSTRTGDPYKILGVKRAATSQDIRKAYKRLAKEWHPDKSGHPDAENKFVEIKQAYELLSDPDRRFKYDQNGITDEDFNYQHDNIRYNFGYDDFFGDGRFYAPNNDITFFHKLTITTRHFDKIIFPRSSKTPYFIFFYTDWCFSCMQAAPYMRKLVDYVEPYGINFVTIQADKEPKLKRRLNVHTLPCLVLLLDGNIYVYKETITSLQRIIDFLRRKLPYKLVPSIDETDVEDFLNGWTDNRVRALVFEPRSLIRLRYLITAFHFRDRVAFGFVESEELRVKYQIPSDMDAVLMFNENSSRPVASITMKDIPTTTLHHIITSNQFLALPRLSSQEVLDSLCPCEWNKPRKKLCVVLVTSTSSNHDVHRETFRLYAQNAPYSIDKVRFAYIYHDKQIEFVNALIPEGKLVEPLLRIVILWRRDTQHVKYEWADEKWEYEENMNDTTQKLENTISRLLRSTEALTYEAFVKELFDEHAKGIVGRVFSKIRTIWLSIYDGLSKEQILPALSVLGTVAFIVIIGFVMTYFVRIEEEKINATKSSVTNNNVSNGSISVYQPELKIHELRSEKYHGLVRLLKPGCRTILLILDMQSRQQLIPPFHKAVWPYRKNKTLMFAYMYIERGISWFKELLELSIMDTRELKIQNPRNCVGTVLALNGHRKYFCMFHAKHTELNHGLRKKLKLYSIQKKDLETAAFIAFDESSSSDSDKEDVLLEGDLLDGLPIWLDKLFEGTTQRFRINYWPEFPNK